MWRKPFNTARSTGNTGGERIDYTDVEQYWIWLSSVEGIGTKRFYQLLSEYEDARTVWDQVGPQMRFIGEKAYRNLVAARDSRYFYQWFSKLNRLGIRAVTRISEGYPSKLTRIADPPPTLYVRGDAQLDIEKAVAVVGSRRATRDGQRAALEIAQGLAEHQVCVVSGLARGIDSCAHQGALNAGGRTIAVLGCGVDILYPPENDALLTRILETGGSVISEYAPGTPPLAQHFPSRNRIISGMSQGVLIVEGGERSGAMITANYALEQGKDVFVVPGSIYAAQSIMPNRLMVDGAVPVLSKWEILEYYRWADRAESQRGKHSVAVELDEDETKITLATASEFLSVDELVAATGFNMARLNSLLTMLELRGIIEQAPGRLYRTRVRLSQ